MTKANDFFREIGKHIASYRKEQNITQEELAKKLGIKQSAMALYESGKRRLPLSLLLPLAEILFVEIEDLLGVPKKKEKRGPKSNLQREFEKIQKMPTHNQKMLLEMIGTFIKGMEKKVS